MTVTNYAYLLKLQLQVLAFSLHALKPQPPLQGLARVSHFAATTSKKFVLYNCIQVKP